ncbi:MAG: polysaccharide ABC transporter ATP-binding protein [Coleofasciculus sp. C1-SOL-03]|uniref:ABC transporter ATP-binding protein n=1 Tax=Coleofasciculus sp. C1-SOL-03 TaxID=3069522 RepID=UPI0033033CB7
MSDTVIQVENLGKKYIIGHQQQERYTALRDVIANGAKSFGQRLLKPWGKQSANPAYEEFWALKDVSFEVKQGDRIGIIGRNGAGKSTLLKILSRITEPTTGRIRIKGRVASLLEVGTGFHPELTGRENIFLNGAILGMSKAEIKRKFDEIVDFAGIEKFLDTPVKRYSSGMYVRLAFAVAAHLEPEILVVDEVLAVGDAQFQKKCLGKMEEVGKEGRTVVFVSHNMVAISTLCTNAILLEQGRKKLAGTPAEVCQNYWESAGSASAQWSSSIASNTSDAPTISLKAVQVKDRIGCVRADFTNTEPIRIEILVNINKWLPLLKIGLELESEWGSKVFTIFHNDIDPNIELDNLGKGLYKFAVTIPACLLNSSTYYVSPCAGEHQVKWFFKYEKLVKFNVKFQICNPEFFVKKRPGIIAPLLKWEINNLTSTNKD